jgi:hypothetical protein
MNPVCASVCRVVRLLAVIGLAWILVPGSADARAGTAATVRGVVWNSDNSPVVSARVRLRDLETGRVASSSETNERGEFSFGGVARGAYLVELLSNEGKVVAVGQSFRVEPGETVATFVRLPSRQSWFAGLFSNTAAAVIAAASSVGVTAVGTHAPPVSPQ